LAVFDNAVALPRLSSLIPLVVAVPDVAGVVVVVAVIVVVVVADVTSAAHYFDTLVVWFAPGRFAFAKTPTLPVALASFQVLADHGQIDTFGHTDIGLIAPSFDIVSLCTFDFRENHSGDVSFLLIGYSPRVPIAVAIVAVASEKDVQYSRYLH